MDFSKYGISTPQDLMRYFEKNMKYGFVYHGKVFTDLEPNFQKNMDKFYKLRLGEDFLKNKYGVCWDFCELERAFFSNKQIEHKCFFIESFINRAEGGPTHTFALYKRGNKWFWFEYAWQFKRGIHEYESEQSALRDIVHSFKSFYEQSLNNVRVYETNKFTRRVNTFEFVEQCLHSKKVDLDKVEEK